MGKLWQKDYSLDQLIEEFTVGRDYQWDNRLIPSDCAASLAHGRMLASCGILTPEEADSLAEGLREILDLHARDEFPITPQDEDGHTAIENYLCRRCGDAGKKIHTGRSRNDQVITALRLYSKAKVFPLVEAVIELTEGLLKRAEEEKNTPMPGRTHMQIAMPSSVGLWLGAFAEELLDTLSQLWYGVFPLLDQCPLGSAASYGVPLPLDREMTARLLGFSRVQNNVLYVNNSRGRTELALLQSLDLIGLTLTKMAQDMILFSLPEFGYFSLPRELCSGSSIMPQKKNPDGLELMRGRGASLSAYTVQLQNILRSLPSGYNRDFQETKEPFLMGVESAYMMIRVMSRTVEKLEINREALEAAFVPEIYATDAALEQVARGIPFREAYRYVGTHLDELSRRNPREALANRSHTGAAGNLGLEGSRQRLFDLQRESREASRTMKKAVESLLGIPTALV